MTQSFFVPGRWPSLNALMDRGVWRKVKLKAEWANTVTLFLRTFKIKPMGRVFIAYEHARFNWAGDPDNYASAAMKITSDALVKQGILAGDTFATVVGFSHAFRLDKKRPGLMVTLEER